MNRFFPRLIDGSEPKNFPRLQAHLVPLVLSLGFSPLAHSSSLPDPQYNTRSTVWFDVGAGFAQLPNGIGVGGSGRFFSFRWPHFKWTLFEFSLGATLRELQRAPRHPLTGELLEPIAAKTVYLGTQPGYPIYWGGQGRHQLWLGLGLGATITEEDGPSGAANRPMFTLAPAADYMFQLNRFLLIGAGVHASLPVVGHFPSGLGSYPAQVFFTINGGFCAGEVLKAVFGR